MMSTVPRRVGSDGRTRSVLTATVMMLIPLGALAQQPGGPSPLAQAFGGGGQIQLADVQRAAVASDPRIRALDLLETQSSLRLHNVAAQWKPSVSVESVAQYQSDAPSTPLLTPGGKPLFAAPKENYDMSGRIEQRLFDTSVGAQAGVERAQLLEQQARVRAAVYAVRQQVNDAFFAAATLQQRVNVLAATITELEGRWRESNARVQQGTALPADAAAIEATLLQRQQDEGELRAGIRAALARLATITGHPIAADSIPVIPDLSSQMTATGELQNLRARPEYEQFARIRDRVARQADIAGAASQPKVSAFGRVGFGRPALDFVQNEWQPYAIGGVRLQWNAWNWGSTAREREAQSLQQQIVDADEAAFRKSIATAIEGDLATIDHLTRALSTDQRIINLRVEVERSARVRLQEGVLTSSDYLARDTELLQARIAQAAHQVELAQAQARLLTTVGVEIR